MTSEIPNYTDVQFSLSDMNKYLRENNVTLSGSDAKKLNTIFGHYDKLNNKGEQKPDGVLAKSENREAFLNELNKEIPGLSDKLLEFFIMVDIAEADRDLKNAKAQIRSDGFDTKI